MAALVLPTRTDLLHYEFETTLDGEAYVFEFRWGSREAAWFMSIFLADGTPRAVNIKVVVGFPLAARNAWRQPPGTLIAFDSSGREVEAASDDLGTRVQVFYYPEGETIG